MPIYKKRLTESGHSFIWRVPETAESMRQEIVAASEEGLDGVILAGGDGTVHDAMPAILESGISFGVLPCGRGNDFARNAGLIQGKDPLAKLLGGSGTRLLDIALVNDRPFGSIACMGFDAMVNRLGRDGKGYLSGKAGYTICVLRALARYRPFEATVWADGNSWTGMVTMVAVANGPCYGGGMRMAPGAEMDDGKLDVCIVDRLSALRLLWNFPRVLRGTHLTHPAVTYLTGRRIVLESVLPREIFADGEYAGTTPAVLEIDGGRKLKVITGLGS